MEKLVVLISGKLRSGKNQIAKYLKEEFKKHNLDVIEDFFANKLKQDCINDFRSLFNLIRETVSELKDYVLDNHNTKEMKHFIETFRIPEENKMFEDKTPIVRKMFQLYGTEVFRNRVDNDYWVKALRKKVEKSDADVILITDCRFPNEIKGICDSDLKTITIRLTRDVNKDKESKNHPSETSLDNWTDWTYIVDNKRMSLKNLKESAKTIVYDLMNIKNKNIGLFSKFSNNQIQNLNKLLTRQ